MADDFQLDEIGQIHISVSDIRRAVEFYRDVLGVRLLFEVPGQQMAFFDCGGIRLYLGVPESPDFRSSPLIYYRTPSAREAHATLERRGVKFLSEPHIVHSDGQHDLWMAFFMDPDGNRLAVMSEEARPN
ncbi:MAG: VOC family protein [Chloroflexota bacterium]